MKGFWSLAVLAALALQADALAASSKSKPRKPSAAAARPQAEMPNGTGYFVPFLTDGAGRNVPIMDIPGSAIVVPRQIIDDQQATSLCGAVRNVAGVSCR